MFARTPKPPYYAVIFSSIRKDDISGYAEMAEKMEKLALAQPGCLGLETAREAMGITVSYWKSLDAIQAWKQNLEHLQAQKYGRESWYSSYKVRIAKIERDYFFAKHSAAEKDVGY